MTQSRPVPDDRANERITMAHGAGGRSSHRLIESVFLPAFANPALARMGDGAVLGVEGTKLAFTTDSFVVSPIFFPGGCLGDLAVNGTLNDLAACGALPTALSAAFVVEEGFPIESLRLIAGAMAGAARSAGTNIVTGDTKVVRKGQADGCYVNCSGIGVVSPLAWGLGPANARPGDRVLVSGPIGDHGAAIMVARGELGIDADIQSDTMALSGLVATLLSAAGEAVHVLRDPTRGGVATVLNEVAASSGTAVVVRGADVPVRPAVAGVCDLLGLDPLYVACEGRMLVVVAPDMADAALQAMRSHPAGAGSVDIGEVEQGPPGRVVEATQFGGRRVLDMLVGDPLPRIC